MTGAAPASPDCRATQSLALMSASAANVAMDTQAMAAIVQALLGTMRA
jgi:hypothetical protein